MRSFKYKKKPVEIEAVQMIEAEWFLLDDNPDWFKDARNHGHIKYDTIEKNFIVKTLEDGNNQVNHIASWDDWIILGVKGELYPIKQAIFEMTYEKVE